MKRKTELKNPPTLIPGVSEAENKLIARRLLEEVGNTGAVERLPEFVASDCEILHTGTEGLAWFREHLLTFRRCYPDMVITVDGQVAEEDSVVTWWTMRGTHSVAWERVAATHKPVHLWGVNIQKVRNGRIVEHFGCSNSLEALLEIGVVRWAKGQPGTSARDGPDAWNQ